MPRAAFLFALLTLVGVAHLEAGRPGVAPGQIRQEAPVTANPLVGNWSADMSKSRLNPSFQFRSVTLQIAVAGDTMTMASRLVSASGQEQNAAETFRTDGTETPGTLTPGVILVARWLDSHVLATIAKKDDQVIALVTYEVSADGMTLTSRSSGMLEQVIVFDRK